MAWPRRITAALFVMSLPAASVAASALTLFAPAGDAGAAGPPSASAARRDPSNVTGISEAMEAVLAGNARFMAKDFAGASEHYRRAIQLQPKNPLGHLALGEALLALGKVEDADAVWRQGAEVGDGYPNVKAKVLFCVADAKERQKKWDDARAAWQRYNEYAVANPDAGAFPASGAARIQAIDDMVKQDRAYDVVRKRIDEERDAGFAAVADAARDARR